MLLRCDDVKSSHIAADLQQQFIPSTTSLWFVAMQQHALVPLAV
jgi:hypothetical protein